MLGNFIKRLFSPVLNFLIMAFAVFCLVKAVNRLHRKKEADSSSPAPALPGRKCC